MQDRYVGDAGDYAKYSLLKALAGEDDPLSLGVLWYLFPNESHNGDGRHISYLQQPNMATRDPDTHSALGVLVASDRRCISAVERTKILPSNTTFFGAPVTIAAGPRVRADHRASWFRAGLRKLAKAELVFLDPDNGIETPALDKNSPKAGKYVFWSEIEAIWGAGKSLVVYNHLNRSASAAVQTERLCGQIKARLLGAAAIMPLLFRRGSCRHMWVIAQPAHCQRLEARMLAFLDRGWSQDTDIRIFRPEHQPETQIA
jgi:hypothetical protein